MKVKTFDGKIFDVPEENLENFLSEYNSNAQEIRVPRGANLAGAIRNIEQATPFIGTLSDEREALGRTLLNMPNIIKNYKDKNIIDATIDEFNKFQKNAEESAKGNIKNTSYGRPLHTAALIGGNTLAAILSRGLTLMPPVSSAQGAIEGFGEGDDLLSRSLNATTGGITGYYFPRWLNKVFPTKDVQRLTVDALAKRPLETAARDPKTALTILAKAFKLDKPVEEVIASEVSKGYRPNLWNNLRNAFKNEDVLRSTFYKSAAELDRPLYDQYVEQEVRSVAPKYANKIGENIKKLKLEQKGSDVLTNLDPREIAKDAVNDAMRKAPTADKKLVQDTIENAIAKKGVAREVQKVSVASPAEFEGTWASLFRNLKGIPKDISNAGSLRTMTVGTPNWLPRSPIEKGFEKIGLENILNFYTPNAVRGVVDAGAENYINDLFKLE